MKVAGIVSEYNPFHNGHAHQISDIRAKGVTHVVAVMSGNFVQRGDIAVTDKFSRAKLAVQNGVDLVLELPTRFALSSAENFAFGAVSILGALGNVDYISFGSECGDTKKLLEGAKLLNDPHFFEKVKEYQKSGITFAAACENAAKEHNVESLFANANDTLGILYLKWILKLNLKIKPLVVKRYLVDHDSEETSSSIASATHIRNLIAENIDYTAFVPSAITSDISTLKNAEKSIISRLRERVSFSDICGVSEGIENRLLKAVNNSCSLEDVFAKTKTKRYTMARIRRMIFCACLNITDNIQKSNISYIRVLAANKKGMEIISLCRKNSAIPLITNFAGARKVSEKAREDFLRESGYTSFYNLAFDEVKPGTTDLTIGPYIEKSEE